MHSPLTCINMTTWHRDHQAAASETHCYCSVMHSSGSDLFYIRIFTVIIERAMAALLSLASAKVSGKLSKESVAPPALSSVPYISSQEAHSHSHALPYSLIQ